VIIVSQRINASRKRVAEAVGSQHQWDSLGLGISRRLESMVPLPCSIVTHDYVMRWANMSSKKSGFSARLSGNAPIKSS
jgi:hypothetical protein